MKILRFLSIVVPVLAIVFVVSRQSLAQNTSMSDDRAPLGRYARLFLSLSERGETNAANEVASLVTAMRSERDATEIATTVRILYHLRSGQTNDAMRMLETRLDSALLAFGAPSDGLRDTNHDKSLKMAKEYRTKYPHTSGVADIDNGVTRAFSLTPK